MEIDGKKQIVINKIEAIQRRKTLRRLADAVLTINPLRPPIFKYIVREEIKREDEGHDRYGRGPPETIDCFDYLVNEGQSPLGFVERLKQERIKQGWQYVQGKDVQGKDRNETLKISLERPDFQDENGNQYFLDYNILPSKFFNSSNP